MIEPLAALMDATCPARPMHFPLSGVVDCAVTGNAVRLKVGVPVLRDAEYCVGLLIVSDFETSRVSVRPIAVPCTEIGPASVTTAGLGA